MSPEQREYVRIFRRAGDNLLNLINDILDLSKVESGHMELEETEFDLAEVLEKASEIIAVRAHAEETGAELPHNAGRANVADRRSRPAAADRSQPAGQFH